MLGLQFTQQGKITEVNKMEICENVDSSKVKIIKVLLTPEDFATLKGDENVNYPIIPGRIAIGQISDASDGAYLEKGTRVFINPSIPCGECVECLSDNHDNCKNFRRAGKEINGYLRDFAVVDNSQLCFLPSSVKDSEAMLIEHMAIALATIDKLQITKGEHVAIIGGGLIGLLLSILIIYYQGVPILIDGNEQKLDRARRAGVYYNLFSDNKLEKEVLEITGAHMAQKVIYVADSNINTDVALKLASNNAQVGFVGFSSPNLKVNFNLAMKKQLSFSCITSGYGYAEQAINMMTNKAIDLSIFEFDTVKYENCPAKIKEIAKNPDHLNDESSLLLVDMM